MDRNYLEILGAMVAGAIDYNSDDAFQELINAAYEQISDELDGTQFNIWKELGRPTFSVEFEGLAISLTKN